MTVSTFKATIPTGPLVDQRNGRATPEWLLWFNQIFGRTGSEQGSNALSAESSSATTQDQVTSLQGTVAMQEAQINALNNELGGLANQITTLQASLAAANAAASAAKDAALIALFSE
jgi:uncharacterized coiled-coil protein SlyX